MINLKNKIGRFKLNLFENINIYTILMIKMLSDLTDKLYMYIDDRSIEPDNLNIKIDEINNNLKLFNINITISIIKYTDYYKIAWIYIYRLVYMNKTILNYNSNQEYDDINKLLLTDKIKIYLYDDTNKTDRNNNILYDHGWFRDIFIESIIDDIIKIDYIFDDILSKSLLNNLININHYLTDKICTILNFNRPTIILQKYTDTISNLKQGEYLNNTKLNDIIKMGINIMDIKEMIENI